MNLKMSFMDKQPSKLTAQILILLGLCFGSCSYQPALAQTSVPSNLCEADAELELLEADAPPIPPNLVTANTISQMSLTQPSLWWAMEQYDPYGGRLIVNWIAYPEKQRIDLVVNRQLWALEDYIGHYAFVSKMGMTARDFGYNLRLFNQQESCLGTYACDFTVSPPLCEIDLLPGVEEGFEF